jgi:putative transposase
MHASMLIRKAHVYRLYPTPEQAATLGRWVGAVRAVYNVALEQRRDWYRPGRRINFASQCREVTALRAEFDWLRDVPVHPLHQAMKDLDRAHQNWWASRARAPTPRKRGINDTMRFHDASIFAFRRLTKRLGEVKIPKLGWVRLRWDRSIPGVVKSITVSRRANIWTVAAQYEMEVADPATPDLPAVGIDRGVAVFAALSDGTLIKPLNAGKRALRALAHAQRRLARKKRGSNNCRKAVRQVARLRARVAAARKDFLHKASTAIAKNHGAVVIEKLDVRNMTRSASGTKEKPGRNARAKSGLNRAILDQGWGAFRTMLAYKLAERGGRLIEVPAANTSRTCAKCGTVDAASRTGQRFRCVACGHEAHADTNAAMNILERAGGTGLLPVEASHRRASEAGTRRRAA